MVIKVIKTETDYENALKEIDKLIDCTEGSEEEQTLELLGLLVYDYEKRMNYELPAPSPVAAIKLRMANQNLRAKDLVGIIGDKPAVSKVLSGKKKLTIPMVKRLHEKLNIPYQSLLGV